MRRKLKLEHKYPRYSNDTLSKYKIYKFRYVSNLTDHSVESIRKLPRCWINRIRYNNSLINGSQSVRIIY